MKAVMLSIQPKWCELIASGKKTVEVRKTKPKLETPFKCYIYCTKGDSLNYLRTTFFANANKFWVDNKAFGANVARANGKVIGEFVCNCMTALKADNMVQAYYNNTKDTCLTDEEIKQYANNGKLYYWHISDLVIYDKPKELSEFQQCHKCKHNCVRTSQNVDLCKYHRLTRPPQSWCYVEGVDR